MQLRSVRVERLGAVQARLAIRFGLDSAAATTYAKADEVVSKMTRLLSEYRMGRPFDDALGGEPRGLVDDQQMVVLVKHFQRRVFHAQIVPRSSAKRKRPCKRPLGPIPTTGFLHLR